MLNQFQDPIYRNKVDRGFNLTYVGKEIVLLTEEYGELCESLVENDLDGIVDALGDTLVYGIGLTALFKWDADAITNTAYKTDPKSIQDILPYIGRSIGRLARAYRRSNKLPVAEIDNTDQIRDHVGAILGYCCDGLRIMSHDETVVLKGIIENNRKRTGQIKI